MSPYLVRLPLGVDVEHDPKANGWRLCAYDGEALRVLRAEIDRVLPVDETSMVTRRLNLRAPALELCALEACTVSGPHVHDARPTTTADTTSSGTSSSPADPPAEEVEVSPVSTQSWTSQDWIDWLRDQGVSQTRAVHHLRAWCRSQGRTEPSGLSVLVSSAELRAELICVATAGTVR